MPVGVPQITKHCSLVQSPCLLIHLSFSIFVFWSIFNWDFSSWWWIIITGIISLKSLYKQGIKKPSAWETAALRWECASRGPYVCTCGVAMISLGKRTWQCEWGWQVPNGIRNLFQLTILSVLRGCRTSLQLSVRIKMATRGVVLSKVIGDECLVGILWCQRCMVA